MHEDGSPDGYYVPKLSEFRFGFEYEVYKAATDIEYEPKIFSAKEATFIENVYTRGLEEGWIRRKIPGYNETSILAITKLKDFIKAYPTCQSYLDSKGGCCESWEYPGFEDEWNDKKKDYDQLIEQEASQVQASMNL